MPTQYIYSIQMPSFSLTYQVEDTRSHLHTGHAKPYADFRNCQLFESLDRSSSLSP